MAISELVPSLANGMAEIVALKLWRDTARETETSNWYPEGFAYGVALAITNSGEWVTWSVYEHPDATLRANGLYAQSGHYFGADMDAARTDYENRSY